MGARKAILAGSWYPANASGCQREIEGFLQELNIKKDPQKKYLAGIVPHAGWYFSGSIACNVINLLVDDGPCDVIAVFGMHLHSGSPNYIMKEGTWETPFGDIKIESDLANELTKKFQFIIETDKRFTHDNTIEVQLPFIKYFFKNASLLPIGVPPSQKSLEIGKAVVEFAKNLGISVKVIGSTDLTHYGINYGFSPKGYGSKALKWVTEENDAGVIKLMSAMDPEKVIKEALENQNACCAGAAATAISAAKALGANKGVTIAYATSHDKSPGDSFVGYAGIVFG
jgi:AmmeMemoRadiSam system protein B